MSGSANFADGAKLDFRVQAAAGYLDGRTIYLPMILDSDRISDWSQVQTFTMPDESSSVSPSQTAAQPENPYIPSDNDQLQQLNQSQILDFVSHPLFLLGVGALFVGVVVVIVVMVFSKRQKLDFGDNFSN